MSKAERRPPEPAVVCPIDLATLGTAREAIAGFGAARGLSPDVLDDFVLAANELTTNVIRHGGGRGLMRLWHDDGTVFCQVSDNGPGMPREYANAGRPGPRAVDGRGLWLVRLMATSTTVDTGPGGTTVTITATNPAA